MTIDIQRNQLRAIADDLLVMARQLREMAEREGGERERVLREHWTILLDASGNLRSLL